jgi:hypothetical protein
MHDQGPVDQAPVRWFTALVDSRGRRLKVSIRVVDTAPMKLPVLLALLVLGAAAAAGAGARVACPAPPSPRTDVGHGYELDLEQSLYGDVTDTQGRRYDVPGVNENTTLSDAPTPHLVQQLLIDPGARNSYVVNLKSTAEYPPVLTFSRSSVKGANEEFLPDDRAAWFIPYSLKGAKVTFAFATGQPVADVRLCVAGNAIPPTGFVSGAQANDQAYPRINVAVETAGAGLARVTLRATDTGSGVAGVWWIRGVGGPRHVSRYTGPFVVRRSAGVIVWAMDRAGNLSQGPWSTR